MNLPSEPRNLQGVIISKQFVTLKWRAPDRKGPNGNEELVYSVFWKEKDSQRFVIVNYGLVMTVI